MVELGHFALVMGFIFALYTFVQSIVCLFRPQAPLVESARRGIFMVTASVWAAALVMWAALFSHDFSVAYVYKNSSIDMPLVYLFAAFWSSLEGSHLLWTLILSTVISVSLLTLRKSNTPLLPGLLFAYGTALSFMMLLNIWASAPLARLFPVGHYGNGMNALLQNPYMAAHPPSLFTGYCSLVVPFAYAWAALLYGGFTPEWLVSVRRWTLWAWTILTVGIFLGGKWAYVELGWAGYWAWDPVENSSFMPWLACTASLHTLLVLDRLGRLPRLQITLAVLAFALTFLGTFITRSGVISSVHSFAESNIGPAYLCYIVTLLVTSFVLLGLRGLKLPGAGRQNEWSWAKESSLLFTNFFLLFLLALVLVGTILPVIVEAIRGVKISIQQPFFNAFAPWVALGLVALLGVGNLLRWRRGGLPAPFVTLLLPLFLAIIAVFFIHKSQNLDKKSTIGFFFICWTAFTLVADFVYKLRDTRWKPLAMLKHNRPYLGAVIVHLGFLVAIAGFLGGYRGIESEARLAKGASIEFYGYTLTHSGLSYRQGDNVKLVSARILAEKKGTREEAVTIEPTRSKYTNKEEWLNEIGVHSTLWHDVYLVLASFELRDESIILKMHINPTVKLVWTSLVIMILGSLLALSHALQLPLSQGNKPINLHNDDDEDTTPWTNLNVRQKALNVSVVLAILGIVAFGFSPFFAHANTLSTQNSAKYMQEQQMFQDIGKELRCPTCQGVSILESETPQSLAMRQEILKQVQAGIPKQQILDFFQQRYGEWILREPDARTGWGFLAWTIPISGLVLGPLFLLLGLAWSRRRNQKEWDSMKKEVLEWLQQQQSFKQIQQIPSPTSDAQNPRSAKETRTPS